MKYIRTLKNLEKIMNYSPELVERTTELGKEKYYYTDDKISFGIDVTDSEIEVWLGKAGGFADLFYKKVDGSWELSEYESMGIPFMPTINRAIRSIIHQIKDGEYVAVEEEKTRELIDEEKYNFLCWISDYNDLLGYEADLFDVLCSALQNDGTLTEITLRNEKPIKVYLENEDKAILWTAESDGTNKFMASHSGTGIFGTVYGNYEV